MKLLSRAIVDACGETGSMWFVSGEPGIGKSRLAEEAANVGRDRGMRVFWGRCWEAGGAPAYWPWIQVLRALLRMAAPEQYEAQRAHLAQILPEVAEDTPREDTGLGTEQARFQLMDAIGAILGEVCRQQPVMVILEDLHAADESTVLLLEFLSTLVRTQSSLIVATFRAAEAKRGPAGPQLLRTIQNGQHLSLEPLGPTDVATFARESEAPLDDEQVRALHTTTEGHPLFMVEVARLWRSQVQGTTGAPTIVPDTVRAAIQERLHRLSPPCRKALEFGSIVGREFEVGLLRDAFGDTSVSLAEALDEACQAATLLEVTPSRFRFSHFLVREVVYDAISREARASSHRRIADVLSLQGGTDGEPRWWEIAHHLGAVGQEAAMEAARAFRKAGTRSVAQLAFDEAVRAYANAQACWEESATRHKKEEIELMIELGHAQIHAGQGQQGKRTCLRAADGARILEDADLFARAALEHGTALMFAQIDDRLVRLLQEALEMLDDGDSVTRARVAARLAAAQQPAPDPSGPMVMAREAIEMARRTGDAHALLDTLRNGGSAFVDLGNPKERLVLDGEHIALAQKLGNRVETLRGTMRLVMDYAELGQLEQAFRAVQSCNQITEELGHGFYRWRSIALQGAEALWRGDLDTAAQHIEQAAELGNESGDSNAPSVFGMQKLRLLRIRGEFDEQRAIIERLQRSWQEWGIGGALMNAAIGAEHLMAGREEAGLLRYDPVAVDLALRAGDRTLQLALSGLAIAAEDVESAEKLYKGALEYHDSFVVGGAVFMTFDGPMTMALARLARFLGREDDARGHYADAIESTKRTGGRPLLAALESEATGALAVPSRGAGPQPREGMDLAAGTFTMELVGESWLVRSGTESFHLKDTKGVRILAQLVREPGREFHVLELAGAPEAGTEVIDRGDAGEVIDEEARREYQRRASDLRQELEEAEEWNDPSRAERARAELEFLTQELSRAVGLGGRERRVGGAAERARVNVQRRVRDAIRRIATQHPQLGKQIGASVRTGTFCAYEPT